MTIRIWVLRHGEAERHTGHDPDRQLTERGRQHVQACGEWLAPAVSSDLCVLVSPYRRAQQTAAQAMPNKTLTTVDWLTPDTNPAAVVEALASVGGSEFLLVSHQPLVSTLIGVLIKSDYRAGPPLDTAALAELTTDTVAPGWAQLVSLRNAPDYSFSVVR